MKYKYSIIAATLATILAPFAMAEVSLQKTTVDSEAEIANSANQKIITSDIIDSEMISNISDTVRYTPGVSVNNTGNRFGDNGFNIRGMDGDAVAITVDGLSQGESLNPTTFSRYGMYSSTRNAIEVESVKSIEIIKGANSILAGSGALGGAVMYTTKDASDFLPEEGDAFGGSVKAGYDGRNKEALTSIALANRTGNFEALAIYTIRNGHETSTHDNGLDIKGAERGQADPFDRETDNLLLKLSYNFSEQHTLGVVVEKYNNDTNGTPLSRQSTTYFDFDYSDESNRDRLGLFYNWQADNTLFDSLDLTLNKQEIFTSGITAFKFAFGSATPYLRTEDRKFNQENTNLTVDFTKFIEKNNVSHDIVYGLISQSGEVENSLRDIRYNDTTIDSGLRDGYPIIDPSWVPKTDTDTWTLYVRDAVTINDQLTISAGLRYDNTSYSPKADDTFVDSGNALQDAEFSALTGQLMASYKVAPNHTIIGSIGSGFKAPTTQELYLNTNATSQFSNSIRVVDAITTNVSYIPNTNSTPEIDLDTVTNPNLDAEEAINYEIAYQWNNENVDLKVTAFKSDYSNMILNINQSRTFETPLTVATFNSRDSNCFSPVVGDECWTVDTITEDTWGVPTNTGEISVTGFEVEGMWQINQQLFATVAYSHSSGEYDNSASGTSETDVDASFEKGELLESISPDNTVIGINYHSEAYKWGISTYATFIDGKSERDNFNAIFYTDNATVVDINAWFNITDNLTIRANVTNLFDEEYSLWDKVRNVREGSGGFFGGVSGDGIDRYSESGRKLSASLSYTF